jgi:hypothetical protein
MKTIVSPSPQRATRRTARGSETNSGHDDNSFTTPTGKPLEQHPSLPQTAPRNSAIPTSTLDRDSVLDSAMITPSSANHTNMGHHQFGSSKDHDVPLVTPAGSSGMMIVSKAVTTQENNHSSRSGDLLVTPKIVSGELGRDDSTGRSSGVMRTLQVEEEEEDEHEHSSESPSSTSPASMASLSKQVRFDAVQPSATTADAAHAPQEDASPRGLVSRRGGRVVASPRKVVDGGVVEYQTFRSPSQDEPSLCSVPSSGATGLQRANTKSSTAISSGETKTMEPAVTPVASVSCHQGQNPLPLETRQTNVSFSPKQALGSIDTVCANVSVAL